MSDVKVVIDGTEVTGQAEMTILEAVRHAWGQISTLCHRPSLTPSGICLICVFEI